MNKFIPGFLLLAGFTMFIAENIWNELYLGTYGQLIFLTGIAILGWQRKLSAKKYAGVVTGIIIAFALWSFIAGIADNNNQLAGFALVFGVFYGLIVTIVFTIFRTTSIIYHRKK